MSRVKTGWPVFVLLLLPLVARCEEGMWTFDQFPAAAVGERYGFVPSESWLEHVRLSSVRIGRGSASFVSPNGLILTNQHCLVACLHQLSSPKRDLLKSGFTARTRDEELRCPGLEAVQLLEITNATDRMRAATAGKQGQEFATALAAAKITAQEECRAGNESERCDVVSMHRGGQYDLYRYRRFPDVRLVFAPEYSIAFFGGDPDNFEFPRYSFDVALARVYENGKPVQTSHWLPLAERAVEPDEPLFVSGHPLSTNRLLTQSQLALQRDYVLPWMTTYFSELRGLLNGYAQQGPGQARAIEDMLFSVENWTKSYKGRGRQLREGPLFAAKQDSEALLRTQSDSGVWNRIEAATREHRKIFDRYTMLESAYAFRSSLFDIARMLVRSTEEGAKPAAARLPEYTDSSLPALREKVLSSAPIDPARERLVLGWSLTKLREYLGSDDATVRAVLDGKTPDELAAELVDRTRLADVAVRRAVLDGGTAALRTSTDPMLRFAQRVDQAARQIRSVYESDVEAVYLQAGAEIAQLRVSANHGSIYPDATGTLRLSYGALQGYVDDGRRVDARTTVQQLFQRATDASPLRLPQTWLAMRAHLDPATALNMVTTNDIVGGNSGSPVVNRNAEVVGVVFDHNRHGFGGDYGFDASVNRAVAVDASAIRAVLPGIYDAGGLVREMSVR